jgi:hypothetical protein
MPCITRYINYSSHVTNSIQKGVSWEANSCSVDEKIICLFIGTEGSLSSSQKLTIGPYPEPYCYSQRHRILFF